MRLYIQRECEDCKRLEDALAKIRKTLKLAPDYPAEKLDDAVRWRLQLARARPEDD